MAAQAFSLIPAVNVQDHVVGSSKRSAALSDGSPVLLNVNDSDFIQEGIMNSDRCRIALLGLLERLLTVRKFYSVRLC